MARSVWDALNFNNPISQDVGVVNYDKPAEEFKQAKEKNAVLGANIIKSLPALDYDLDKENSLIKGYRDEYAKIEEEGKLDPRRIVGKLTSLAHKVNDDMTLGERKKNADAIKQKEEGFKAIQESGLGVGDQNFAMNYRYGVYGSPNAETGIRGHETDEFGRHKGFLEKSRILEDVYDDKTFEALQGNLGTTVGKNSRWDEYLTEAKIGDVAVLLKQGKGKITDVKNLEFAKNRLLENRNIQQGLTVRTRLETLKKIAEDTKLTPRQLGEMDIESSDAYRKLFNQNLAKNTEQFSTNFINSYASQDVKNTLDAQIVDNPYSAGNKQIKQDIHADVETGDSNLTNINVQPQEVMTKEDLDVYDSAPAGYSYSELGVNPSEISNIMETPQGRELKGKWQDFKDGKIKDDPRLFINKKILTNIGYDAKEVANMPVDKQVENIKSYYNTLKQNPIVKIPKEARQYKTEQLQAELPRLKFKIPEKGGYYNLEQFADILADDKKLFERYIDVDNLMGNKSEVKRDKADIIAYLQKQPRFDVNGFTGKTDFGHKSPNFNYTAKLGAGEIHIAPNESGLEKTMEDVSTLQKRAAMPNYRDKEMNTPVTVTYAVKQGDTYKPAKSNFTVKTVNKEPVLYIEYNGKYVPFTGGFKSLLRLKAQRIKLGTNLENPFVAPNLEYKDVKKTDG